MTYKTTVDNIQLVSEGREPGAAAQNEARHLFPPAAVPGPGVAARPR